MEADLGAQSDRSKQNKLDRIDYRLQTPQKSTIDGSCKNEKQDSLGICKILHTITNNQSQCPPFQSLYRHLHSSKQKLR